MIYETTDTLIFWFKHKTNVAHLGLDRPPMCRFCNNETIILHILVLPFSGTIPNLVLMVLQLIHHLLPNYTHLYPYLITTYRYCPSYTAVTAANTTTATGIAPTTFTSMATSTHFHCHYYCLDSLLYLWLYWGVAKNQFCDFFFGFFSSSFQTILTGYFIYKDFLNFFLLFSDILYVSIWKYELQQF